MKVLFESRGGFDKANKWLTDITKRDLSVSHRQIANQGIENLRSNTPKDTGETAAGWTSQVRTKGDITEIAWMNRAHPGAQVNVAKIIELGHATGTGGYVPPKPYIKKSMDPVFKDAVNKLTKELIK